MNEVIMMSETDDIKQGLIDALNLLIEINNDIWMDEREGRGDKFSLLLCKYGYLVGLTTEDALKMMNSK